jgi:Pectate lyase superfamily protein
MSIVQISRIQHRSGLYENLPQLSKAELGYSVDTRQLFIGNGLVTDGAPESGNTEILTEYSDILNLANLYNFKNSDAGYNPQTGNAKAQFNGMAYNGSLYVVVGSNGNILTSTDGSTWSQTVSGTTNNLLDIAYGGGTFVAVGANGTVLYSTNGTVWQPSGAVSYTNINAITYASSKFVLVTLLGEIYTSNNGITWTLQSSGVSVALNAIAYGNSTFVVGGTNGTILTSSDAITWINTTVGYYDILGLRYITDTVGGSSFVAVAAYNKVYTSTNGTTWTRSLIDAFVSVTNDGTNSYALTSWGDVYKNSGGSLNYIASITTGIENFTYIYYNISSSLFTALTGSGGIYTSSNGTAWTLRTSGVSTSLNGVYADGTTWVVVGDSGVILTSTTGTTFTSRTSGTSNNLKAVTKGASPDTWIAVGSSGTVVTSSNSTTWTVGTSGTSAELRAVAVANLGSGTYKAIAVGTGGIGITSSNGGNYANWSSAISNSATNPAGNTVTLSDLNNIIYLTFTPPGGSLTSLWIVVGDHGIVATSSNGSSWFTKTTTTYSDFTGITFASAYFFVVGNNSLTYLRSQDATTYTAISEYYGSNVLQPDLYDITSNATTNIIGGQYGYLYTSNSQFKYWKKSSTSLTYSNRNMAYFNNKYYAIGDQGHISISTDASTWSTQSYSYGGTTTQRAIQKKLDDFVSVKDFGAKGDGVTDDTEAINRAMYELYCRTTSLTSRKILWFPAGNYIVNGSINVPSHARLRGEGNNNTQITQTANPYIYPYITWVMYTADNLQQTSNLAGLNGATLPNDIVISDMALSSLNDGIIIDNASSVSLSNIRFIGPNTNTVTVLTDPINGSTTAGVKFLGRSLSYSNDIDITHCLFNGYHVGVYLPTTQYMSNALIDSCSFENLYHGVYLNGTSAIGVTLTNSVMDLIYNSGVNIYNATNFISMANYYKDVGNKSTGIANPFYVIVQFDSATVTGASIGDNYDRPYSATSSYNGIPYVSETATTVEWDYAHGLRLGTINYKKGNTLALANNTTAPLLSNLDDYGETFGLEFQYTITRNGNVRSGVALFTLTSGGLYSIDDSSTQSGDVGVTFGYNGSTDITYTTDASGTGLINYAIRYFEML